MIIVCRLSLDSPFLRFRSHVRAPWIIEIVLCAAVGVSEVISALMSTLRILTLVLISKVWWTSLNWLFWGLRLSIKVKNLHFVNVFRRIGLWVSKTDGIISSQISLISLLSVFVFFLIVIFFTNLFLNLLILILLIFVLCRASRIPKIWVLFLFLLVNIVPHQFLGCQPRILIYLLLWFKCYLTRIFTFFRFIHACLLLFLHDFVSQVIVHLVSIATV